MGLDSNEATRLDGSPPDTTVAAVCHSIYKRISLVQPIHVFIGFRHGLARPRQDGFNN
jgi:hypothetical protein